MAEAQKVLEDLLEKFSTPKLLAEILKKLTKLDDLEGRLIRLEENSEEKYRKLLKKIEAQSQEKNCEEKCERLKVIKKIQSSDNNSREKYQEIEKKTKAPNKEKYREEESQRLEKNMEARSKEKHNQEKYQRPEKEVGKLSKENQYEDKYQKLEKEIETQRKAKYYEEKYRKPEKEIVAWSRDKHYEKKHRNLEKEIESRSKEKYYEGKYQKLEKEVEGWSKEKHYEEKYRKLEKEIKAQSEAKHYEGKYCKLEKEVEAQSKDRHEEKHQEVEKKTGTQCKVSSGQNSSESKSLRMPKSATCPIDTKTVSEVIFTCARNNFYFGHPSTKAPELLALQKSMLNQGSLGFPLADPQINDLCAVKVEQDWCRGRITHMTHELTPEVTVFLIDYGDLIVFTVDKLKVLPVDLETPSGFVSKFEIAGDKKVELFKKIKVKPVKRSDKSDCWILAVQEDASGPVS